MTSYIWVTDDSVMSCCLFHSGKITMACLDLWSLIQTNVRLTNWAQVTHICVRKLNIIGSGNGLSLSGRQVITWINVDILLIGILGTNFSEILRFHSRRCIWKCLRYGGIFFRLQCVKQRGFRRGNQGMNWSCVIWLGMWFVVNKFQWS